jgi:DNA-binding PadR family transcriptional regulator
VNDDILSNLHKSIQNSSFYRLHFSDQLRNQIHEKIRNQNKSKKSVYIAIFQILKKKKTGYELLQLLRARGIKNFDNYEGNLYTVLHYLEKNKYLRSSWNDLGCKFYQINDKGLKILQREEKLFKRKEIVIIKQMEGRYN